MNEGPIMHGLCAIAAFYLFLHWSRLLWIYQREADVVLRRDKPRILALGLVLDSIGVCAISTYRVLQYYGVAVMDMQDAVTNVSLLCLLIGTSLLLWAAGMDGHRWQWRTYLGTVAAWLAFVYNVPGGF